MSFLEKIEISKPVLLKLFKDGWIAEMLFLHEKLEEERLDLRGKLIDIFNRASPEGKKSLLYSWGYKDEILPLLVELDKNGFPGASKIYWACQKFGFPNIKDEVSLYINLLDPKEINEESFDIHSQIPNGGCKRNKTNLVQEESDILIPGLLNEISISCIAKVPTESWGSLLSVSKAWLALFTSGKLYKERKRLDCQEKVIMAEIRHFQERIVFSPKEDCWRWFPRLKIVDEQEVLKKKLGVSWDYDASTESSTVHIIGSTGEQHTYKIENGEVIKLMHGDGKLVVYYDVSGDFPRQKSFVTVDLETMEAMTYPQINELNYSFSDSFFMDFIMKDGKLCCFGYQDEETSVSVEIKTITVDLKSGLVEITPLPYWWECCGLALGKIFAVTTKEDDYYSTLLVKYYDEKRNYWITVEQLPRKEGIFEKFSLFTKFLKVKVIKNKLYILEGFEYDGNEVNEDGEPWFIHVLSVSVEKGEVSCAWELQFSKIKDPKGNSPSGLDFTNFQVVEL